MPLSTRLAFPAETRCTVFPKMHLLIAGLGLLAALALGACGGDDTNLKALTLDPDSATMVEGDTRQFTATGTYQDDTTADFTLGVYWSTSSNGILSVDQEGLATAEGEGQSTVSATDGVTGVFDSASVTVLPAPVASDDSGDTGDTGGTGGTTSVAESFSMLVDGTPVTYTEAEASNPIGFDPWVYAEYDAATGSTLIAARGAFNSGNSFFEDSIELAFEGQDAGSYDYATNDSGRIYYRVAGNSYGPDFTNPVDTEVLITVDSIGNVGEPVTGTFSAVLCDEAIAFSETSGDECGNSAAQVALTSGTFDTTREPDLGTLAKPKFLDRDFGSQFHRLDAAYADELYYVLYDVTPGTAYSVEIRQMDEDLTLVAFGADASFTTNVACNLLDYTGIAGTGPEQCVITAGGSDTDLYFKVVREDPAPAGLAFYEIEAQTVPGSSPPTGETFAVTADGEPVIYAELVAANPIGFDPWVYTEYDAATGHTVVGVRFNYNPSIFFFDDSIEVVFEGKSAGSFDYAASQNGRIDYRVGGTNYGMDFTIPLNTDAFLTVDSFGAVGAPVSGTFNGVLCDAATVVSESGNGNACGNAASQITLTAGTFDTNREPDLGTLPKPKYLDRDSGPQTHLLDADYSDELYYILYNVTPGASYSVEIRQLNENLTLVPYGGNSSFSAPIGCNLLDDTNKAGPSPERCVISAGGSDTDLYFKVVRETPSPVGQTFFDIEAKTVPAGVDLAVEIVAIVDVPGGFPDVIAYRVVNNGDTPSPTSFNLDFYEDKGSPPAPGDAGANWTVPVTTPAPISPYGGTYADSFTYAIFATGSIPYLTVDAAETVAEGDEGNNVSPPFDWGTFGRPFFITTFDNAGGNTTDTSLALAVPDSSSILATNDDGGRNPGQGYSGMVLYSSPGQRLLFRVTESSSNPDLPYSIVVSDAGYGSGASPGNPSAGVGEPDNTPLDATPLFLNVVVDSTVGAPDVLDFYLFEVPN